MAKEQCWRRAKWANPCYFKIAVCNSHKQNQWIYSWLTSAATKTAQNHWIVFHQITAFYPSCDDIKSTINFTACKLLPINTFSFLAFIWPPLTFMLSSGYLCPVQIKSCSGLDLPLFLSSLSTCALYLVLV